MRRPTITCTPDTLIDTWRASKDPEAGTQQHGFVLNGELVTPMFGGGVEAGQVDKEQPIRATGIIGQLRHWWRITCGESDSATLFKRETVIWGGIGREGPTASKVRISVTTSGKLDISNLQNHNYATFPARESRHPPRQEEKAMAQPGLQFRITMALDPRLPESSVQEIRTAIRWWASFGGIGARTRRGLGATRIQLEGPDQWLTPVPVNEVERLGGRLCLRQSGQRQGTNPATSAWNDAVNRLKQFRQGVNVGRNPGQQFAGRSRWPEADTIRRRTRHDPKHPPEHPVNGLFPRAAFGLPIVFHFKDRQDGGGTDTVVKPVGSDRLASPLILRPYWDGNQWRSAALLLPGWEKTLSRHVESSEDNSPKVIQQAPVWPKSETEREAVAGKISPMQGRGTDPLSAFMAFFMEGAGS